MRMDIVEKSSLLLTALCMLWFQGDSTCSKADHLSDPQLFDSYFEKLLCELTEQDFTDPVLADALQRLRGVSSSSDSFKH